MQNSATGEVSLVHPLATAFARLPKPLRDVATLRAPANIVDMSNTSLTRYWEFAAPPSASSSSAAAAAAAPGSSEGSAQVQQPPVIVDMVSGIEIDIDTINIPRVGYLPQLLQEPAARRATQLSADALRARAAREPQSAANLWASNLWAELRHASIEPRTAALAAQPVSLSELHVAALYLGFGLQSHPELCWLASAALCAELPYGWGVATSPRGDPYYYNPALLCVQWEHPAHCYLRALVMVVTADDHTPTPTPNLHRPRVAFPMA